MVAVRAQADEVVAAAVAPVARPVAAVEAAAGPAHAIASEAHLVVVPVVVVVEVVACVAKVAQGEVVLAPQPVNPPEVAPPRARLLKRNGLLDAPGKMLENATIGPIGLANSVAGVTIARLQGIGTGTGHVLSRNCRKTLGSPFSPSFVLATICGSNRIQTKILN